MCVGVDCPHVVDTGEALVCTLTGICVGDLVFACFDYTSTSTRFNVSTPVPATSFVKSVSAPSTAGGDAADDAKGSCEQLYAECYRVVSKMLSMPPRPARPPMPPRPLGPPRAPNEQGKGPRELCTGQIDRAAKLAGGVAKKRRDGKFRLMPVVFEFVRLMQEGAKPGATESQTNDWQSAVARRCADCCAMSFRLQPNATSAKMKPAYVCLAVLYMLREGVTVKGVRLCVKDEAVASQLPSLNSLALFGYQKSKYTKAERFLREAIKQALFTRPLHEIRF